MQILVPVSTYLDTSTAYQTSLMPLSQMIETRKERVRLDGNNVNLLRLGHNKKGQSKPVRLMPVPLGQLLAEVESLPTNEDAFLLIPGPNFDAAPYNNMVQSILYRYPSLQTCTLDCYGAALSYMVQGLVSFCNHKSPTTAQLALFVDKLSEQIQTYVVCPHTPVFEPRLHPFLGWMASLLRLHRIYRSEAPTWHPTKIAAIGRLLESTKLSESKIWVDSHDGTSHARWVVRKFKKWGLREDLLALNKLRHTSTSFPRRFVLVTITPNKKKVKQLADWAMRWEE